MAALTESQLNSLAAIAAAGLPLLGAWLGRLTDVTNRREAAYVKLAGLRNDFPQKFATRAEADLFFEYHRRRRDLLGGGLGDDHEQARRYQTRMEEMTDPLSRAADRLREALSEIEVRFPATDELDKAIREARHFEFVEHPGFSAVMDVAALENEKELAKSRIHAGIVPERLRRVDRVLDLIRPSVSQSRQVGARGRRVVLATIIGNAAIVGWSVARSNWVMLFLMLSATLILAVVYDWARNEGNI